MDELTRLAHRARLGDAAALERLAEGCYEDVWRLCAALVDAESADDLAQETVVRMMRAVRRFRGDSSARTWILAIARHACVDEIRARSRESRRRRGALQLASFSSAPGPEPVSEVRDLLVRLHPERRAAFALTQLLRLSYEEAAAVCDCPIGTIRSRVARAREELIGMLQAPIHLDGTSERPPAQDRVRRTTATAAGFEVGERAGYRTTPARSRPVR